MLPPEFESSNLQAALDSAPPIPPQGIHPHFVLNENLEVDLAPPTALDAQGNNVALMRQLLPALRDLANAAVALLSRGNRAHGDLLKFVTDYANLLPDDLAQLDRGRLYVAGLLLGIADEETQKQSGPDGLPALDVAASTSIRGLLQLHGSFILATREGQEAIANADRYERDAAQEAARRADAMQFAAAAKANSQSDDERIFTSQAAEALVATTQAAGKGPYPDRSAALSLAMVRNASIIVIAPSVIFAICGALVAPVIGSAIGASTATGALAGLTAGGSALFWEGVKKSKLFGATAQAIGSALDHASDPTRWPDDTVLRRRLAAFPRFTRTATPILRNLARRSPQFGWLDASLDWLASRLDQPTHLESADDILSTPTAPPPGFSLEETKRRILAGEPIPSDWRPFIRELNFAIDLRAVNRLREPPKAALNRIWAEMGTQALRSASPLAELTLLTTLNLAATPVTDLAPLAALIELQSLNLRCTKVTDLAPLAALTALQSLNLADTQVTNLAPLGALTALQSLELAGTRVTSLAPLAALIALQSLDLAGTQVTSLAPLAALPALQSLNLLNTQVTSLAPLAPLTALQSLNLVYTKVTNLTPLAALTALQSLDLTGTQVTSVAPLAALTALRFLSLVQTQVTNLAPLAALPALQTLDLRGTRVTDLAPLATLTALQTLDLAGIEVSNLGPLAALTALQTLYLQGTQVTDLTPLATLTALQSLELAGTRVTNLAPLASLTALQFLNLWRTDVTDLAPLATLTALQFLGLQNTQVTDLAPLAALPDLKRLDLTGLPEGIENTLPRRAEITIIRREASPTVPPAPHPPFIASA